VETLDEGFQKSPSPGDIIPGRLLLRCRPCRSHHQAALVAEHILQAPLSPEQREKLGSTETLG
jgi:hypothetical protein